MTKKLNKNDVFSIKGWAVVANDGYVRAEIKRPKGSLGLVARRCIITIVEPKKKCAQSIN
jgi:hypothetical protein